VGRENPQGEMYLVPQAAPRGLYLVELPPEDL
jgi:hypothetical protein